MRIKYLGHSCFLITSEKGIRILTDPFDEQVGYALPAEEADIVTTSHSHFDHNHVAAVKGPFTHLGKPGQFEVGGVRIEGISTYHDEEKGAKRGKNVIYIFDIDGLRVCHCGDLGHQLSTEQMQAIGKIDILLVPVGGTFTVEAAGALEIVHRIKPVVTIPMHFQTEVLKFKLDSVDKFLKAAGEGEKYGKQELEISKESILDLPHVIVLDYK